MSRGERLFGPKRNTRRNKREYRRKKGTKRYLDNKNVVISDLMGRNAVLRKKLKDRDIQLEEQRKVKELYEKQNHNIREVCFHAMIDKLDAFLRYYLLLLLSFSHRVLSSYPNFSVVFLFIQRLHAKRLGGMGVNMEATFQ